MGNVSENPLRFRRRFFAGSVLALVLMLFISEICFLFILSRGPLVESPNQEDIGVIEEWIGASIPKGSILQKMQYNMSFTDVSVSVYIGIPADRTEQFETGLPDSYVLKSSDRDCDDYDNVEDPFPSYIIINKGLNGLCQIHIEKIPDEQIDELFYRYMHEGRYCLGR